MTITPLFAWKPSASGLCPSLKRIQTILATGQDQLPDEEQPDPSAEVGSTMGLGYYETEVEKAVNEATIDMLSEMQLDTMAESFRSQKSDPAISSMSFADHLGLRWRTSNGLHAEPVS